MTDQVSNSLYQMFETSARMEREGIIVNYGAAGKFSVARAGGANDRFAVVFEKKTRGIRRQIEAGILPQSEQRKILIETFVETVLLGWEGVKGKDGNVLEFNRENAIALFADLPALFDDLREQASDFGNFRAATLEADAKN